MSAFSSFGDCFLPFLLLCHTDCGTGDIERTFPLETHSSNGSDFALSSTDLFTRRRRLKAKRRARAQRERRKRDLETENPTAVKEPKNEVRTYFILNRSYYLLQEFRANNDGASSNVFPF